MAKKKNELTVQSDTQIDETELFKQIASIIETRKTHASAYINREVTLLYWEVGHHINSVILEGGRATYGKSILSALATKLIVKYGKSFSEQNLYRMMQFAERFPDIEILSPLATKLSWTHFCELIRVKTVEGRMFYAEDAATRLYSAKELRRQISRKAYERRENGNSQLSEQSVVPFNVFKDPYLLDVLNLKDNFLEGDLEQAIIRDIETFLLEFGRGIAFVERQKRMIIDGRDFELDLLLYSRAFRRLIAIELKIGEFKAADKAQMELYLKWLENNERMPGEEQPIGIILCPSASREIVEMLEMDKAGIAVAEYLTELPPRVEFEQKLRAVYAEAQERLHRRKLLPSTEIKRDIEYFYESKDDDDE